jgi:hypothetical protein
MRPSAWLNAALAICWFLWLCGKRVQRMSIEEAHKFLDTLERAA